MVGTASRAVHRGRCGQRRHADFPQPWGRITVSGCPRTKGQRVAMTCAQIAIMPRNNASEARAAASSKTARNIVTSRNEEGTMFTLCSARQVLFETFFHVFVCSENSCDSKVVEPGP